jgi:LacI family transcriptional regulator
MQKNREENAEALGMAGTKPTLKTISRLSGLAVPTVSRALNDAPDIGAETKKRIRRIADEIGYVPNRAGVRLRTGRTNVISLVISTEHDIMNQTARLLTAIAGKLRGTRYHLNVTPFFPGEDMMRPVRYIVDSQAADAIIMNQIEPEDERVRFLLDQKFPFATHGRSNWSDEHAYADFDNEAFARASIQKLHQRGRKHVLLLAPPIEQSYSLHMRLGTNSEAAKLGIKLQTAAGISSDAPNEVTRAYVRDILLEDPTIDAIVCGSSNSTMASVSGAEDSGRVLGQDVDIVGKEAISFLKLFRKELLVVPEDVRSVGEFLADAAIKATSEPDEPPMQWIEVPSVDTFL